MKYGYIRVSTREQNIDRQIDALGSLELDRIFIDKMSGKDFNRPLYQKMLRRLRPNDVIYVKSIDRLGRNYNDIQEQWRHLTKDLGVDICVVDMPLLDTRRGKDLIGTFIADLTLQILSFVAQTERDYIKERQREGIASAKARGVRFGRPRTLRIPDGFDVVCQQWVSGDLSGSEAARKLGISRSTFMWLIKRE